MSKKAKKIIQTVAVALIMAIVIAADIVCGIFSEFITIGLYGYGIKFSNLDFSQGNQICQDIAEEGIVLLKNENNALPLDMTKGLDENNMKKVSVFGWGATDGGFITSGAGSGGSADRGAGKLVTFLGALEGQEAQIQYDSDSKKDIELMPEIKGHFAYYHPLMDMYSKYKSGRDKGDYWNAAYPFFNLIEPDYSKVEPYMAGAAEFSDTAIVVISRVGGEGQDMPRVQKKWDSGQPDDNNKTYLQISKEEEDMLTAVRENFDKVIVIVNACNAMDLSFLEDFGVDAALSVGGTGQSGTVAITNLLRGEKDVPVPELDGEGNVVKEKDEDGKETTVYKKDADGNVITEAVKVSPSGKTADTYAFDHSTAATYANAPDCRTANGPTGGERSYTNASSEYYVDYAEGIYVGYKWYETADAEGFWTSQYANDTWGVNGYGDVVQYPFGYGLSYTDFKWEVVASPAGGALTTGKEEIKIQVKVTNIGDYPGQDVVQVYYTPEYYDGGIEKSAVNLAAFAKTGVLEPNGFEVLTLSFKAEDMKSYDCYDANGNGNTGYELEHGEYKITLRTDAHTVYTDSDTKAEDMTFVYNAAKDIYVDEDVDNRFTGDSVIEGDVAIDGSDTEGEIKYLVRSQFETTFPTPQARRSKASNMPVKNWQTKLRDTDVMPTQGADKDEELQLQIKNEEGKTVLNLDLILELGADYNNSKWDLLLDQITTNELFMLVQSGGYQTPAIDSISKPRVTDLDGPSGINQENMSLGVSSLWTSYPVETVMAQSWNADLSYLYGLAVGSEAYQTNVSGWYAPACNIHRSPFDGRNFEYFSEDAYLSGVMCAKSTLGALNNGLYCYVKHFAVNECEYNRAGLYTWLTEQTLREIYLRPFEMAVKDGKANAIMSSFNRVGATWAGGNYSLLTGVLRNEWGFQGSVVTDYSTGGDYMDPDQGTRAGNDIWLNGARSNSVSSYNDKSSATAVTCAREATKNVLFTYCNTIYIQKEYDPDADVVARQENLPAPLWAIGLAAINLVGVAGCGVWIYFLYFRKKKVEPVPVAETAGTAEPVSQPETTVQTAEDVKPDNE